tara:strand:+ start:85 stop:591 length:507 start_codon:yes stop_codon:yes gene_type:complete
MYIPDLSYFVFAGICLLTIITALGVVLSPNLIHSAVFLLFTLFGVAGLYVFLYADFIAATQVIIYVGGILVLIIFGVMLTNNIDDPKLSNQSQNQIVGAIFSFTMLVMLINIVFDTNWNVQELIYRESTVNEIGIMLLSKYLLPFEIVSILLLAALIGAAMLSRKKVD